MSTERSVGLGDSDIHYIEEGGGKPVLLLHGASFNARTWEEVGTVKAVGDAGFRAIAPDLPGKGLSSQGKYTEEGIGLFLGDFIGSLALRRPVLLGASYGGFAALNFALSKPTQVSGLILVGVSYKWIHDYGKRLGRVRGVPSLLIQGAADEHVSLDDARRLMDYIGAMRVAVVGKIHPCYLEEPVKFNNEVVKFLAEIS